MHPRAHNQNGALCEEIIDIWAEHISSEVGNSFQGQMQMGAACAGVAD